MDTLTLTLFLLIVPGPSALNISDFHHPVIFPLATSCCDTVLSADASFFYCSNSAAAEIRVFKNSGYSFEPFQTIYTPVRGCSVAVDGQGDRLFLGASTYVYVF